MTNITVFMVTYPIRYSIYDNVTSVTKCINSLR